MLYLLHQVFSKYGRVDDVYLMRDDKKQSRGMFSKPFPSVFWVFLIFLVFYLCPRKCVCI